MKKAIAALTLVMTANGFAAGIPDGNFKGQGRWKSARDTGTYEVTTTVKGNSISSIYNLPDGSKKDWIFSMDQTDNGFFKVKTFGAEIGTGYCLEKADVCHYEINVGKLKLEETISLLDGKLYRFGSKDDGSGQVSWQEAMDRE